MEVATSASPATPAVAARSCTALTLLASNRTHCRLTLLRPIHGIATNADLVLGLGITEIAGGAGCGKTQIALSLCVSCACTPLIGSLDSYGKAIFISLGEGTSQHLVAKRLSQMASARIKESADTLDGQSVTSILARILIRFIRNQDEFDAFIFRELPHMLEEDKAIAFVALDSIAAMFRDLVDCGAVERSGKLFKIAAQVKRLSVLHRVPFLTVNQVTTNVNASDKADIPALGSSWANCVNESFFVSRIETTGSHSSSEEKNALGHLNTVYKFQRKIRMRFSPSHRPVELRFEIVMAGAERFEPKNPCKQHSS